MHSSIRRRFRILRELAEGGFGKVYLAEMLTGDSFSKIVALKLLHGHWSSHKEILQRSRDEARLLGRLRHRNIVRVEDLTSINGQCAVVMEYLEGMDMKGFLNYLRSTHQQMPVRAAFEVSACVLGALEAAYNHIPLQGDKPLRLIHRDIKPSNIMITVSGEVKLLDFGTARANFETREALTEAITFGSQSYMAPERHFGEQDSPAGDVFSLGVTIFELLAGANFGKSILRQAKFEEMRSQKLGELDLSRALSDSHAKQATRMLRQMLDYDPDCRPTIAQALEWMEIFVEQARDTSLRRLCRRQLPLAMETQSEGSSEGLSGGTFYEDDLQTSAPQEGGQQEASAPITMDELPSQDQPVPGSLQETWLPDELSLEDLQESFGVPPEAPSASPDQTIGLPHALREGADLNDAQWAAKTTAGPDLEGPEEELLPLSDDPFEEDTLRKDSLSLMDDVFEEDTVRKGSSVETDDLFEEDTLRRMEEELSPVSSSTEDIERSLEALDASQQVSVEEPGSPGPEPSVRADSQDALESSGSSEPMTSKLHELDPKRWLTAESDAPPKSQHQLESEQQVHQAGFVIKLALTILLILPSTLFIAYHMGSDRARDLVYLFFPPPPVEEALPELQTPPEELSPEDSAPSSAEPPEEPPEPEEPPPEERELPTGEGSILLILNPIKGGDVLIYQEDYGFQDSWGGGGRYFREKMRVGNYLTRITDRSGAEIWRYLEVKRGQLCRYRFDVKAGKEWELIRCEDG